MIKVLLFIYLKKWSQELKIVTTSAFLIYFPHENTCIILPGYKKWGNLNVKYRDPLI